MNLDELFEACMRAYDTEGRHSDGISRVIGLVQQESQSFVLEHLNPEAQRDLAAQLMRKASEREGYGDL